jgi:uncharacterized membrane protein
MKKTYRTVKNEAKARLKENFGHAAVIVLLVSLFYSIASQIITSVLTRIGIPDTSIVITLFSIVIGSASTYITYKLLLDYVKGKNTLEFKEIFEFDKNFISYLIFGGIAGVIGLLSFIPFIPYITDLYTIDYTNQAVLEAWIESNIDGFIQSLGLSLLIFVVIIIISVRFMYARYIIVEQNKNVIDALKTSWRYTQNNYFRVLLFPLSFILWIFLIPITCGLVLIWLIPYISVAQANLYLTIKAESGDYTETIYTNNEPKDKPKEEDPLGDYYL